MHAARRYSLPQVLLWSRGEILVSAAWSTVVTAAYVFGGLKWLAVPWLPMSLIGVAVAFYIGFKNNASYDRQVEARSIWGGIVNNSRAFAMSIRDLLSTEHGDLENRGHATEEDAAAARRRLLQRHAAWLDALRFQLRVLKPWEHQDPVHAHWRRATRVPEFRENVAEELGNHLDAETVQEVLARPNPAVDLLSRQSRELADLRRRGLFDGFAHMEVQKLVHELTALQGKAERIKNFPFPRQYATVNIVFARLFVILAPCGLVREFSAMDGLGIGVWVTIPFATLVSWVFLCATKIGDWSENPFEGLPNDVPISTLARAIQRDVLQIAGVPADELPPAREPVRDIAS